MCHRIILLSGPICAGKTSLAEELEHLFAAKIIKTTELVRARMRRANTTRLALQKSGDRLDKDTKSAWLIEDTAEIIAQNNKSLIIIESVRSESQIKLFRYVYRKLVLHVHLTAPQEELEERYRQKFSDQPSCEAFSETQKNRTEKNIDKLKSDADILIDTARNRKIDVFTRVASALGFFPNNDVRCVDVLIGGQYGSEGKGNISAYLAPEYDVLVRVGGPNAGHKIYYDHNVIRTFKQLPSGTPVNEQAQLILGPGAVIDVAQLLIEINENAIDFRRLSIDPQATVILQKHKDDEKEIRKQIASTGSGTGYAMIDRLRRTHGSTMLARDAKELQPYIRDAVSLLDDHMRHQRMIFLEGTQGSGLSIFHGSYPHVTSRDTNASGCLAEAGIAPHRVRRVIMVCRAYPIRVGNSPTGESSGPMAAEISPEIISKRSCIPVENIKKTEITTNTKTNRRISEFDWILLRKSASLNAPTDVALTFADYIDAKNEVARRFDQLTPATINFIEEVERVTAAPVSLISTGFNLRNIIDRRSWVIKNGH